MNTKNQNCLNCLGWELLGDIFIDGHSVGECHMKAPRITNEAGRGRWPMTCANWKCPDFEDVDQNGDIRPWQHISECLPKVPGDDTA